jgi:hypothetical protein
MKTRIRNLKWLMLLLLFGGATGVWAQTTLPDVVCPGPKNYWVNPGNVGNNFSWSITPGVWY